MNKPQTCNLVKTSYSEDDVLVLLKDLTGQIEALDTEEREKLNQSGKHYSEMLPVEYKPTEEYLRIYNEILEQNKEKMAQALLNLANKIFNEYGHFRVGGRLYIVSLARAGTPIGILLKRILRERYSFYNVEHCSVSIIRGKRNRYKCNEIYLCRSISKNWK